MPDHGGPAGLVRTLEPSDLWFSRADMHRSLRVAIRHRDRSRAAGQPIPGATAAIPLLDSYGAREG